MILLSFGAILIELKIVYYDSCFIIGLFVMLLNESETDQMIP